MNSPRILCVIDTVGKGGGAEHLVATLAPALRTRGVEIAVAAIADWPDNYHSALTDADVPLYRLEADYEKVRPTGLRRICALARRERYDIYWGHLVTGIVHARAAAMAAGGKSIATIHSEGYGANPPRRLRDRIATGFEGRVLGGADARVAVSNAVARDYAAFFGWDDIAVAYNGVDIAALKSMAATCTKAQTRAAFDVAPDEFLIVTAARYVEKKGQKYLIEAVAQLVAQGATDVKLLLFGSGVENSSLGAAVKQAGLGDRIAVRGVIDQSMLMPLIAAADAYVMPSLREPFGIAAAEAMALGTPTILTEVDGFLELVGGTATALMAQPADAAALADRLLEVRRDPDVARAMGARAAARIAERFSLDACASRWIEIFDAVDQGKTIPPCAA